MNSGEGYDKSPAPDLWNKTNTASAVGTYRNAHPPRGLAVSSLGCAAGIKAVDLLPFDRRDIANSSMCVCALFSQKLLSFFIENSSKARLWRSVLCRGYGHQEDIRVPPRRDFLYIPGNENIIVSHSRSRPVAARGPY